MDEASGAIDVVILEDWENGGSQRASVALLSSLATRRKRLDGRQLVSKNFHTIEQTTVSLEKSLFDREAGRTCQVGMPNLGQEAAAEALRNPRQGEDGIES